MDYLIVLMTAYTKAKSISIRQKYQSLKFVFLNLSDLQFKNWTPTWFRPALTSCCASTPFTHIQSPPFKYDSSPLYVIQIRSQELRKKGQRAALFAHGRKMDQSIYDQSEYMFQFLMHYMILIPLQLVISESSRENARGSTLYGISVISTLTESFHLVNIISLYIINKK